MVYVHHNARINGIDHKRHRKSVRLLNTFYTRVQQSILRHRQKDEYGASRNVRDAWISDNTLEKNKFSAKTRKDLDNSKLNFDAREIIGDDEILEDMRTRAESSMANERDNQNEQDGGIALEESREQALKDLDDLRYEDFTDKDIPPPTNAYNVDFDADDITRTHPHGSSSMASMDNENGDDSVLLEVDESTALRWDVGCIKLYELNEQFPRRRLPMVHLNEPGVLLSTNKLRNLVEIYSVLVTSGDSTQQ
ncbi:hypothetical protein R1flu_012339 [Riccia fluitans]|uniref:Uncharacterized protein n=1 Tax=Riccia fluitans TaxID=41844 RepID=A0ABD1ZDN6_9MARC